MQRFHIHNKYKYSRIAKDRILESDQLPGKKRKNNKTNSGIKQKRRDLPMQKKKEKTKGKSKITREDKSDEKTAKKEKKKQERTTRMQRMCRCII